MAFFETKIQKNVESIYDATFEHDGSKIIKKINPLCNCVKFRIKDNKINFKYKTTKTSNKIVVITYEDDSKDFLELQAIKYDIK